MKTILAFTFVFLSIAIGAASGQDWIHPPSSSVRNAKPMEEIPAENIREVVASTLLAAESILENHAIEALSEEQVRFYAGDSLRCRAHSKAYLLRAIYGYAGTGRYFVQRYGSNIVVTHGSLGHGTPLHAKSALVVCLDFQPSEIFNAISVAE